MTQDQDPTGMRHLLASLRESGPMPDDLAERIRATLADEQAARTDPDRAGEPDEDSLAEDEGSGFWSTMSEPDGPRRRRSVAPWILGAAAATVVALGVGGLMLSQSGSDEAGSAGDAAPMQTSSQSSATESSAAADGSEAGGEVPAFSITASGTDYTRSSLGSEAATLLEDPTQAPEPKNDKVLVAQQGFEALLNDVDEVVGGDEETKQTREDNRTTPEPVKAHRQAELTRPRGD